MVVIGNLSYIYFCRCGIEINGTVINYSDWSSCVILEHAHRHQITQLNICREYMNRCIFRSIYYLYGKNSFFATSGSTGIVTDTVEGSTRVPGGDCKGISTVVVSVRLRSEMCSVDTFSIDEGMPLSEYTVTLSYLHSIAP